MDEEKCRERTVQGSFEGREGLPVCRILKHYHFILNTCFKEMSDCEMWITGNSNGLPDGCVWCSKVEKRVKTERKFLWNIQDVDKFKGGRGYSDTIFSIRCKEVFMDIALFHMCDVAPSKEAEKKKKKMECEAKFFWNWETCCIWTKAIWHKYIWMDDLDQH